MCKLHTKNIHKTYQQTTVCQTRFLPSIWHWQRHNSRRGHPIPPDTNSKRTSFSKMLLHHKRNLMRRGYSNAVINKHLRSIKFSIRKQLILKSKDKNNNTRTNNTRNTLSKPTFKTRYYPNPGKAFRIIR